VFLRVKLVKELLWFPTKLYLNIFSPAGLCFRVDGVAFCDKEMFLDIEDPFYCGDKYKFSIQAMSQTPEKPTF
jgi:hypothetical protein